MKATYFLMAFLMSLLVATPDFPKLSVLAALSKSLPKEDSKKGVIFSKALAPFLSMSSLAPKWMAAAESVTAMPGRASISLFLGLRLARIFEGVSSS